MFPICKDWAIPDVAHKRSAIQRASLCACISQATADDVQAFFPDLAGRLRVIPLGADHLGQPGSAIRESPVGGGYVLFVGLREQYKNFWLLPAAMRTAEWPRDLAVHVVGPPATDPEVNLLKAYGLHERVRFLGRLTDEELRRQYQAARCFIFPSLIEGFGIPLLEAQINGCPVLCSDIPVFREVAGEAAIFFDSRLYERLASAIATANEPGIRARLVEAGFENVRRFSWDAAAEKTYQLYEEATRLGDAGD
jgi:glycosyltransferase involved in cell wall biosynthesis